jgi:hypothetical protein
VNCFPQPLGYELLLNGANAHWRFFCTATRAASRILRIISGLISLRRVDRRPASEILAAYASKFGELRDTIQRHASALLPILNGLVADAHLPSHVGDGVKLGNGVFESLVHFPCAFDQREAMLAQEPLVTQVKIQLPQVSLAGIFPI